MARLVIFLLKCFFCNSMIIISFLYISIAVPTLQIILTVIILIFLTIKIIDSSSSVEKDSNSHINNVLKSKLIIFGAKFLLYRNTDYQKELDYIYKYYLKNYDEYTANISKKKIIYYINNTVKIKNTKNTVKIPHKYRLKILFFLFEVASVNKPITKKELYFLKEICKELKINQNLFDRIKENYVYQKDKTNNRKDFFQNRNPNYKLNEAYRTLDISVNSNIKEVKKAYRVLAQKYHPDKHTIFGEGAVKKAEKKFKIISQAYKKIIDSLKNY